VRQSISPEMSRQLFADLVSCLNKLAASLEPAVHGMGDDWMSPFQVYEECSSAEEMMARTKQLVVRLCEAVSASKTDSLERIYARIKDYIDDHCLENSLSLHSIAEHLNMSPSYLSVSFKKHSGQTISDYILRARVEHAKSLLADHRLTITDIAQQVGYANNIGFIRAFKRLEGITPGQYRQSLP
jgi:AraC-like DNA-binding protein